MAIRGWGILSLALGLAAVSIEAQQTIPKAQGTALSGSVVSLPDAVQGKVGVLVVGFSKASQGQVAGWGLRLASDFNQSSTTVYFEVAMLAGAPKIVRGIIVKSMKSSVPQVQRPHFLPLMENDAGWRLVAHYSKPDDAYVLLIDASGSIHWQTEGAVTDASYGVLKKNLASLTGESGLR